MSFIVIHRQGNPNEERAVEVEFARGEFEKESRHFFVNPRTDVGRAIGSHFLSTHGRVLCFAQGLVAAGHRVLISDRRTGQAQAHSLSMFVPNTGCANLFYYLHGRAWGSHQWHRLAHELQTFIAEGQRKAVYESTARYYFAHPWEQEIRLQLPR